MAKLDQIAWTLNLRGTDIKYNPLFKSYLLINEDHTSTLYINPNKVNENVAAYLKENNVTVKHITEIFNEKFVKVAVVANEVNDRVVSAIEDPIKLKESPIEILKAVKNEREIQGFRECHIRDGAALVSYLAWLEKQLLSGAVLDEFEAAEVLAQYRYKQKNNKGLSFASISSSGANAAVVHYHPT